MKTMAKGRKSKYNPATVERLIEEIGISGNEKRACNVADVCNTTLTRWKKEYPDFAQQIQDAHREYRRSTQEAQIKQARSLVTDYLFNGYKEVHTSTMRITTDGKLTIKEETKIIQKPTPEWVINRVLGQPMPLVEAMKTLLMNNIALPQQADALFKGIESIEDELRSLVQSRADEFSGAGSTETSESAPENLS